MEAFRAAAEEAIAEERQKRRHLLANDLEKILYGRSRAPSAPAPRGAAEPVPEDRERGVRPEFAISEVLERGWFAGKPHADVERAVRRAAKEMALAGESPRLRLACLDAARRRDAAQGMRPGAPASRRYFPENSARAGVAPLAAAR